MILFLSLFLAVSSSFFDVLSPCPAGQHCFQGLCMLDGTCLSGCELAEKDTDPVYWGSRCIELCPAPCKCDFSPFLIDTFSDDLRAWCRGCQRNFFGDLCSCRAKPECSCSTVWLGTECNSCNPGTLATCADCTAECQAVTTPAGSPVPPPVLPPIDCVDTNKISLVSLKSASFEQQSITNEFGFSWSGGKYGTPAGKFNKIARGKGYLTGTFTIDGRDYDLSQLALNDVTVRLGTSGSIKVDPMAGAVAAGKVVVLKALKGAAGLLTGKPGKAAKALNPVGSVIDVTKATFIDKKAALQNPTEYSPELLLSEMLNPRGANYGRSLATDLGMYIYVVLSSGLVDSVGGITASNMCSRGRTAEFTQRIAFLQGLISSSGFFGRQPTRHFGLACADAFFPCVNVHNPYTLNFPPDVCCAAPVELTDVFSNPNAYSATLKFVEVTVESLAHLEAMLDVAGNASNASSTALEFPNLIINIEPYSVNNTSLIDVLVLGEIWQMDEIFGVSSSVRPLEGSHRKRQGHVQQTGTFLSSDTAAYIFPVCGDGVLAPTESCDVGISAQVSSGCNSDCTVAVGYRCDLTQCYYTGGGGNSGSLSISGIVGIVLGSAAAVVLCLTLIALLIFLRRTSSAEKFMVPVQPSMYAVEALPPLSPLQAVPPGLQYAW